MRMRFEGKGDIMNFYETTLRRIVQESSDSYSYIMDIPEGYTWKAGQHAMFKIKDYKLVEGDRDSRIFTIASAPQDEFLMFTTRIGELHSGFKDHLLKNIKVGDKIEIAAPLGSFDFDMSKYKRSIAIAGGIGITPIRSLLRHYADNNDENHAFTVIYSDDRGEYAYDELWEELKTKMPNLDLRFVSERDEFTGSTNDYAKEFGNESEYLIAGSPGMNAAFTQTLIDLGVDKENIKTDNFMGY